MAATSKPEPTLHCANRLKGAIFSALFCVRGTSLGLLATLLTCWAPASLAADCPANGATEAAIVRHVHDGDTLWLKDGRKLRLIGIDTPELAREQQPEQAYAREARAALIQLLRQSDNRISIAYGKQHQDRYQRTLAHLYLADGRSVQAHLLSQGYAAAFTTPPNDSRSACYRQAEAEAMRYRRGIWALDRYQLKSAEKLRAKDSGFARIEGRVSALRTSKKALWLDLGKQLQLRIDKRDLANFDSAELQHLEGKNVQVRGWLHTKKDHFFMALRHRDALIIK